MIPTIIQLYSSPWPGSGKRVAQYWGSITHEEKHVPYEYFEEFFQYSLTVFKMKAEMLGANSIIACEADLTVGEDWSVDIRLSGTAASVMSLG